MDTITPELNPFIALTDEQFFQLCQHSDYRFERTASGALIVMSPTEEKPASVTRNCLAGRHVEQATKLGGFRPSGGFVTQWSRALPDAALVKKERWNALTPEQRQKFLLYLLILSWSYALPVIR